MRRLALCLIVVLAALAGIFHHAVASAIVAGGAGLATGTNVSFSTMRLGTQSATFTGLVVRSRSGEPILNAARLDVAYDLRDLLPGSARMYGLRGAGVVGPQLTIIRHPDGSFNVPIPSSSSATSGGPPYRFDATLRDGRVVFIDETRSDPAGRRIVVDGVDATLDVDTAARTTYALGAAYVDGGRDYPLHAEGAIDEAHPFTLQHIWARRVPIANVANVVVANPAVRVDAGELDDLDVRVFGFARSGALQPHVTGSVALENGRIAIAALTQPIAGVHGTFDITESAIATTGVWGRIGNVGATLRGGVYDLHDPQARFALDASASLDAFRRLARAAAALPRISGPVALRVLVEGPALRPQAFVTIDSPRLLYNGIELGGTSTLLAASPSTLDVLDARTQYGGVHLAATGTLAFARGPLRLLLAGTAPASGLPFVQGFVPGMTLRSATLATAPDLKHIELAGYIRAQTQAQTASAIFHVDSRGVGSAGPLLVDGRDGSLYARIDVDHPHARIAVLASAHDFAIAPVPPVPLGNFRVPAIPLVAGRIDGSVLGVQNGRSVAVSIRGGGFERDGDRFISDLDATVGMRSGGVDVAFAHAHVAGGQARAAGSMHAGRGGLAMLLSGARVAGVPLGAAASLALTNARIDVRDAVVQAGSAIVNGDGRISMHGSHAYVVDAGVHGLDLHDAASLAAPTLAEEVTGSADADLRIAGSGSAPVVTGTIDAPEGSVYGEGFRALRMHVAGGLGGIALDSGSVALGDSSIAFGGYVSQTESRVALSAPRLDLSDLNDFFDSGDTFAGTGRLDATIADGGSMASSGSASFHNARFRGYDLGTTVANWSSSGSATHVRATTASSTGRFRVLGDVAGSPLHPNLDLAVRAQNVALGSWLPPVSLKAPVLGLADATATIRGEFPALSIAASARATHVLVGRVPMTSLAFAGTFSGRRSTIRSATLSMPYLNAAVSGTFGLAQSAPLDLRLAASSTDIGALARVVSGKKNALAGGLRANATLSGTARSPQVASAFSLSSVRYARFTVPRVAGRIVASRSAIALEGGEADLTHGRLLASGRIPIATHGFSLAAAPLRANVRADDVALANFAPLLPAGTQLGGRIDGNVLVAGRVGAPSMSGAMQLAGGSYAGPWDKAPLDDIGARIALAGTTLQLQSLSGRAGSGSVSGSGRIVVADLADPANAAYSFALRAANAGVNAPKYFTGTIDASVTASHVAGGPIAVGGNVTVSHARIPVSALYHPSSGSAPAALPAVAFERLGIRVGPDVRVQNSSVDVGGEGFATLSGTLVAPVMAGAFHSTGGTVNFYQLFRVQSAVVRFDPSNGITPSINAVAATSVANPPTDIRIHVTGPATSMQLGLSSDPNYDRSQILGLLVGMQSFGAVQGVPGPASSPFSASAAFQRIGFGEANQIFTKSILQPLSTTLGGALGTQNLALYSNIGTGYGTGIGASIEKRIAQHVTMTTSANIGYPRQEMVDLRYMRRNASDVQLSVFQQQESFLNSTPPGIQQGPGGLNLQPSDAMIGGATSGVLLSFERRYWSCAMWHYCLSCSHC